MKVWYEVRFEAKRGKRKGAGVMRHETYAGESLDEGMKRLRSVRSDSLWAEEGLIVGDVKLVRIEEVWAL